MLITSLNTPSTRNTTSSQNVANFLSTEFFFCIYLWSGIYFFEENVFLIKIFARCYFANFKRGCVIQRRVSWNMCLEKNTKKMKKLYVNITFSKRNHIRRCFFLNCRQFPFISFFFVWTRFFVCKRLFAKNTFLWIIIMIRIQSWLLAKNLWN